ncbi:hypothetical protein [Streptomyces subrutilus]|uniref:Uncharacterized protein n=1 Tax=Streptomyces subrutilus TaxID=36818 RepID=A0A1E5NXW1_9ACTN|nr:hypothetical protein [Streptomyces subrutilus]OEJ21080.1 hypothetical protein BGK67_34880 [Streptomyces subrutilus]
MSDVRAKLEAVLVAVGLLAVAFPSAVPPLLGAVGAAVGAGLAVAGWVLAHLSFVCAVGAGVTLAYAFPDAIRRSASWIVRASVASVAAVLPRAT